ncbi:unnamed protein product [Allacma fusca]|uniref:IQ motif and ubiquitin-like domain-containing protein n=1 Tax=Allacma fusca TaxID=39272 RepID=A0A8J2K2Z9_9HEXA|nr:unnamed protein product [Allacma fusca]
MSDNETSAEEFEEEETTLGDLGVFGGSQTGQSNTVTNAQLGTQEQGQDGGTIQPEISDGTQAPEGDVVDPQLGMEDNISQPALEGEGGGSEEEDIAPPDLQKWNPNFGFDSSYEEDEMVEIDDPESGEAVNNETQTPTNELLSFEDPRLFDIDLGRGKKPQLKKRLVKKSKGQEEYQGESQNDYKQNVEMEGEDAPPQPKTSLEEFDEIYMKPSDSCIMRRFSENALTIGSRLSTPSPPETPDVTPRLNRCPSIESFFKLGEKITVHFYILPGGRIYSRDIRLDTTIGSIKEELSKIVKVPAKYLELRRNKNLIMDYKTLKDAGGKPGKKLRFTVEVAKRAADLYELKIPEDNKLPPKNDLTRKVRILTGSGCKIFNISIEYPVERKLFLGGYKHKVTGLEYHHVWTQTALIKKEYRDTQADKATQAFRETNNCAQTVVDTYTQVERPDYFISCRRNKLVRAGRYLTAARWLRQRELAAITIQRFWRGWLAVQEKEKRMMGLIKRVEWAEQVRKGRLEIRMAIKDDELYRQYNPSTLLDIELLYRAINTWRKQEVDYVLMNRWGAEKKAALADIMEKEADLLLDLERAKTKIINEKNKHLVEDLYKKMGSPDRWLSRTGRFVTVDNPGKELSRTYENLYRELKQPVTDGHERMKLLHKLYKLIKNHKTVTTEYLIQLIGREIALMERKARDRILVGLRKRILTGFFALCRDVRFNPESRKLQKVPFDMMKLRKDMVQCKGCRKMFYRDQFTISKGVTVTNWCLTCMGLYRTCILRVDMNLFRRMLQELRQDEQEQGVESSVAYVIDAYDLQFLIEQIWHGQSALSGIDDRYLLRLCRWIKEKPWTPWNCVLLTEEEAVAHLHIRNMNMAYQSSFFEKVRLRHNAARSYFQRTSKIALALDPDLESLCLAREVTKKQNKNQISSVSEKRDSKSLGSLLNL